MKPGPRFPIDDLAGDAPQGQKMVRSASHFCVETDKLRVLGVK